MNMAAEASVYDFRESPGPQNWHPPSIQSEAPSAHENGHHGGDTHGSEIHIDSQAPNSQQTHPNSLDSQTPWDDPAYFEPPSSTQELLIGAIEPESLRLLLNAMGNSAWTGEGREWEGEFITQGESPQDWYKRHSKTVGTNHGLALLRYSHQLYLLCDEIPSASDIRQQTLSLSNPERVRRLRQIIHAIQTVVDTIAARVPCDIDEDKNPRQAQKDKDYAAKTAKSLRRKLIPMLLLTLKAAYMMGSRGVEPEKALPRQGIFTTTTMQILTRLIGWVERLYTAMILELEMNPPVSIGEDDTVETRRIKSEAVAKVLHRLAASVSHVGKFKKRVLGAMEQLEEQVNGAERRRMAMEKDKRLREERLLRLQQYQEAQDRQMALFWSSSQGTASQPTQQHRVNAANHWGTPGEPLPREEYRAENGWYWDEDNILLSMIRNVSQPNLSALAVGLPGRSEQDISNRIYELKYMSRRHYEEWNMVPPRWCMGD